jgi:hypothetical protein
MHEAIAMGPTGNLQGTVKFFCLTMGCILKRRSFTPYPMPERVIKRVNAIGLRQKQGRTFRFLNRRQEPYQWTDTVPEDDPEFQGLLEDKEEAAYPDISAELLGVELESEEVDYAAVTDEPVPDFEQLAATTLDNAGIDPQDCLCATRGAAGRTQCYPDPSRRSVVGHQPYDTYAPRMSFLQMGEMRAHRSVLDATKYAGMTKQEQIHATTWSETTFAIDDTKHTINPELVTESEDEMKVWGYLMTQYNLKPGLRKFGEKRATAAMDELTQLHAMDTWTAMDPSKLS